MTLKPLICPNCGGTVNRARKICEYCGTQFEVDDGCQIFRVEKYTSPTRTFQSQVIIPNEEFNYANAEALTDYTISKLRSNLMEAITDMLELKTEYDPCMRQQIITARVRVVDPNYRF